MATLFHFKNANQYTNEKTEIFNADAIVSVLKDGVRDFYGYPLSVTFIGNDGFGSSHNEVFYFKTKKQRDSAAMGLVELAGGVKEL